MLWRPQTWKALKKPGERLRSGLELTEEQFGKKFIVKPRKVLQVGFLTG